ncbi:hypothetical protein [Sandaracinus amylolyticus]|nr:hypothetical protein [Sandaracinus amylolyticus]
MMRRTTAAWVLVLALSACARSTERPGPGHELEGRDDAATTCDDAGPGDPTPGDDPLDPQQATCLGLAEPVCASCHLREGTFYLRPSGPPPPPTHVVPLTPPPPGCVEIPDPPPPPPLDPASEIVLTDEQAACLGIDRPPCTACHRRHDVLVLRPIGVPPPPPDTGLVPVDACL